MPTGSSTGAERASVEAWLAEHPDAAAEVEGWQRQNEALTALFGPVAKEPIPARLGPQLHRRPARRPRLSAGTQLAAAAVVLVAHRRFDRLVRPRRRPARRRPRATC